MSEWTKCDHEWEEVDSEYGNENYSEVICKKCKCPGEKDLRTGDVFWPAT